MPEIWLRSNRRYFGCLLMLFSLPLLGGVGLALWSHLTLRQPLLFWTGAAVAGVALIVVLLIAAAARVPRLAYEDGHLVVNLGTRLPQRVPVYVVECFFLGQGPTMLPEPREQPTEASNIVVRLAESAEPWKHQDVKPQMGHWCDGYITIHGAWCEPISGELVTRMNSLLLNAHRQRRDAAKESA